MDEINIATNYGLINGERVREMLFLRPHKFNFLLSGRNAHPDVLEAATRTDVWSEDQARLRRK